jgi:hypothetical protein
LANSAGPPITVYGLAALASAAIAAWLLPNSAQLFRSHWNAIDLRPEGAPPPTHRLERSAGFGITSRWAWVAAAMLMICLALMESGRRFIYVQF